MTSYSTEYATSARTSRVAVLPAHWTELERASAIVPDQLARFVLLDPAGQRHAIRTRTSLLVPGLVVLADDRLRGIGMLASWGALLGGEDRRWDGLTFDGFASYVERTPRFATRVRESGLQLAARLAGTRWTSVIQEHASRRRAASVKLLCADGDEVWLATIAGSAGAAAIGEDGRVLVAVDDGRLCIYGADGDAEDLVGRPRVTVSLDEPSTHASAIGTGCVLLSRTRARMFGAAGEPVWDIALPFAAHQPAIDGGDGRVYLAGDGLALIERGRLAWARPSAPVMATAYGDGTLAVSASTELQRIAPDGTVVQRIVTPIAATLLTPPAIDPRGHVWVASSDSVWTTR